MSAVLAARERLAAEHGAAELAFCFGFPYADFPGCGVAIAAYAETQAAADARRRRPARPIWTRMSRSSPAASPRRREAVAEAIAHGARRRAARWSWRTPRTIPAAAAMATPPACWPN